MHSSNLLMLNDNRLPLLSGHAPAAAVILLHGLGDSGAGLIDLGVAWREALPDAVFVAPDAPHACDMAPFGYQWFSLQDRSPTAILRGVQQAAPILNAYIDSITTHYQLPDQRVALVGFSQGTMMSLYVGPRRAKGLGGILGYSGALIGAETLLAETQSKPPVLLVHGMQDDVVPFAAMRHAEVSLHAAGIAVETLPCPNLAHSIDQAGLQAGARFLRKIFTGTGTNGELTSVLRKLNTP